MFGESEVEDLGLAATGDENVGRLDVAVDDAFGVGGIERIGDLDGKVNNLLGRERAAANAHIQGHAFEQLHGDKTPTGVFADFIDGTNIGMIQGGGGASLALETLEGLWVMGQFIGQELEGHMAAELEILGFEDHTHPAAAQLADDAVVRDGLADHVGQW